MENNSRNVVVLIGYCEARRRRKMGGRSRGKWPCDSHIQISPFYSARSHGLYMTCLYPHSGLISSMHPPIGKAVCENGRGGLMDRQQIAKDISAHDTIAFLGTRAWILLIAKCCTTCCGLRRVDYG